MIIIQIVFPNKAMIVRTQLICIIANEFEVYEKVILKQNSKMRAGMLNWI